MGEDGGDRASDDRLDSSGGVAVSRAVCRRDLRLDMLRAAARAARRQGLANVRFLRLRAEEITPSLGPLRLAAFGNSFHRTDRVTVARALFPLVAPRWQPRHLASSSVRAGEQPWRAGLRDTINAWTGQGQRSGARLLGAPHQQDGLREAPFGEPRVVDILKRQTWTTDTLIGRLYSSLRQLRGAASSAIARGSSNVTSGGTSPSEVRVTCVAPTNRLLRKSLPRAIRVSMRSSQGRIGPGRAAGSSRMQLTHG